MPLLFSVRVRINSFWSLRSTVPESTTKSCRVAFPSYKVVFWRTRSRLVNLMVSGAHMGSGVQDVSEKECKGLHPPRHCLK